MGVEGSIVDDDIPLDGERDRGLIVVVSTYRCVGVLEEEQGTEGAHAQHDHGHEAEATAAAHATSSTGGRGRGGGGAVEVEQEDGEVGQDREGVAAGEGRGGEDMSVLGGGLGVGMVAINPSLCSMVADLSKFNCLCVCECVHCLCGSVSYRSFTSRMRSRSCVQSSGTVARWHTCTAVWWGQRRTETQKHGYQMSDVSS